MTEYEAFQIVIDLETRSGENGEYFVTGLFAFVMVIYLFGRKMTKSMVVVLSTVYSAYAFLNIVAVWSCMSRIVQIQDKWPSALGNTSAPESAVYFMPLFWFGAWAASMLFLILVLKQKIEAPNA